MASTPVAGDLVLIGPPTSQSAVGAAGLYLVIAQQGSSVTVVPESDPNAGKTGPGLTLPLSRVLQRYASS